MSYSTEERIKKFRKHFPFVLPRVRRQFLVIPTETPTSTPTPTPTPTDTPSGTARTNRNFDYIEDNYEYIKKETIPINKSEESDNTFFKLNKEIVNINCDNWKKTKLDLVDNDTFLNRLSICKKCEFWDESGFGKTGKCKINNTSTQTQLRSKNEKCPNLPSKW